MQVKDFGIFGLFHMFPTCIAFYTCTGQGCKMYFRGSYNKEGWFGNVKHKLPKHSNMDPSSTTHSERNRPQVPKTRLPRPRQVVDKQNGNRYAWIPNMSTIQLLCFLVVNIPRSCQSLDYHVLRKSLPRKKSLNQDHLRVRNQGIVVALGFRGSIFVLNL